MIVGTGKKAGKSTQELILKEIDWVQFFVAHNPQSALSSAFARHGKALKNKPYTEECFLCQGPAKKMTVYAGNAESVMFWCSSCDPYSQAALLGKLYDVNTVDEVLRFVDLTCGGRRLDKRKLIRRLAEAKGLPKRVGQAAAISFLGN